MATAGLSQAMPQRYGASMEAANWSVEQGNGQCALVQDIPRYGQARFVQANGRKLSFVLEVRQGPVQGDYASLETTPPPWKHGALPRELASLKLQRGSMPVQLNRELAQRLMYELEQGMFPQFHYRDWADQHDEVSVALSALRFREVVPEFRDCLAGLIQLDFDFVSEHIVYFDDDSHLLHYRVRRELDRVIADYRKRGTNPRVIVGGHADERGTDAYNMSLSRKRAEEVKRYLARRGIPASKIEVRAFGERWPASKSGALAQNRRATIWLAE